MEGPVGTLHQDKRESGSHPSPQSLLGDWVPLIKSSLDLQRQADEPRRQGLRGAVSSWGPRFSERRTAEHLSPKTHRRPLCCLSRAG